MKKNTPAHKAKWFVDMWALSERIDHAGAHGNLSPCRTHIGHI